MLCWPSVAISVEVHLQSETFVTGNAPCKYALVGRRSRILLKAQHLSFARMREDNWKNLEKKEREAELPQDAADVEAEKFVLAAASLDERLQDILVGWSAPRVK